ncbi:MAG: GNAT family N-acetyltransferase [Chryseobacterium sp.]|nr:MAG: GNAT family N-acetyltransferase [Chryseobacterium sp.]
MLPISLWKKAIIKHWVTLRQTFWIRVARFSLHLINEQPVGVCALIKMNDPDYEYELAKMAVAPSAQGKGIAVMLCNATIKLAKDLGATKIYLESSRKLTPAMRLYEKLGFKEVTGRPTPYARCDIQMELDIR